MLEGDHLVHDIPDLKVMCVLAPLEPPSPSRDKPHWNTLMLVPKEAWPPKPMDPLGKTQIVWTRGGIHAKEIEHALPGDGSKACM